MKKSLLFVFIFIINSLYPMANTEDTIVVPSKQTLSSNIDWISLGYEVKRTYKLTAVSGAFVRIPRIDVPSDFKTQYDKFFLDLNLPTKEIPSQKWPEVEITEIPLFMQTILSLFHNQNNSSDK